MKKVLILLLSGYSLVILPSVPQVIQDMHPRFQDYALRSQGQVRTLQQKKLDLTRFKNYLVTETEALQEGLENLGQEQQSLQKQLKKLNFAYKPLDESAEQAKIQIDAVENALIETYQGKKDFVNEIQSYKQRVSDLNFKLKLIEQEQQRIKNTENAYHQRALNKIMAQNAGRIPSSFNRKDIEIVKESLMDEDGLFDRVQYDRERGSQFISEIYAGFLGDPDLQEMKDLNLL